MTTLATEFVARLASISNELGEALRQHIDYYDEVLPNVVMGDITRLVVRSANDAPPDWLTTFLREMNLGYASGVPEIADLIVVSFVENLHGEAAALRVLAPLIDNPLRAEIGLVCGP